MIGVIADDLTGAAEIGAVGLRHGLRAEIIHDGPVKSGADLVCFNTDTRSLPSLAAGRRAAAAAAALVAAGAQWIYKKTDSVLRGPVAGELEAILKQLGRDVALLVPSNPALGRTTRDGRYYIHGRPIHQTEFARDPEHPRRSPDLRELLRKTKSGRVHVCAVHDQLPATGIAIGEAASVPELRHWAARSDDGLLPAGGSGFFAALLAETGHKVSRSKLKPLPRSARELFVCGSTSESTRCFVSACRKQGAPIFSLPEALARGGKFTPTALRDRVKQIMTAFRSHQRVILGIGLPPIRNQRTARRLATDLARLAAAALHATAVDHVYAEGGATAMQLVLHAGWERLTLLREAAPGVATMAVGDGKQLLTIKPGSYVWPEKIPSSKFQVPNKLQVP